jgi:two-component system cell cycle sensor histidine kinase PleC
MFSSLRLFSILSLLAMVGVGVAAGVSVRNIAADNLKQMVTRNSVNLAQGYVGGVWVRYRDVIIPLAAADASALQNNAAVTEFAKDTVRFFQKISLVRANIYNADGRLLMTSNADGINKLMGEAPSPDSAFVTGQFRQSGPSINELHKIALQTNPEATLLQTVIPIRMDGSTGGPEGAIEILYDMSKPWQALHQFQLYGTAGILGMFLVLLGVMIMTSRKAESIIAKQYEANMELAQTAETAKAENMQKSQFLANISHELRTPLNAIIGFSDIIKNEVMVDVQEKKYHDYIGDIHTSGVHLLSLINDILDYSKAEAGKLELEVSEVNAGKLIQNSMRLVAPRAETAKVTLTDALPKEQIIMFTDSKKFKQILLNLLSNAVKFTPAGGEVRVTAWRDLTDDTYSFEVKDTGIGIAPKDISRAMSPFGQVDSALSRKYEGTGLGLPLTKKFVEIMGGKFVIESKINVGTTITFTLPRELKEREGLIIKQVA